MHDTYAPDALPAPPAMFLADANLSLAARLGRPVSDAELALLWAAQDDRDTLAATIRTIVDRADIGRMITFGIA